MVDCQIIKEGKVEGEVRQNGLTFIDNHGMERSNHIESDAMEVSLKEWHYQKFGIMNQHYLGKANNAKFIAQHEVRPALLFSMPTFGSSMKEVYGNRGAKKEMMWKTGEASLCFLSGEGGANTHLNQGTQFEIFNVVIPQQFIEKLIEHDPEAFDQLSPLTNPTFDTQTIIKLFQYLFDFRMNLAVHYLLDTSLPIADIGVKLGYDYQSHFCTAFKRKHGVSPMEFRLRRGVID